MSAAALALWLPLALGAPSAPGIQAGGSTLELPPSTPGRWAEWTRGTPAPEALREDFVASVVATRAQDPLAALDALARVLRAEPDFPPALHRVGVLCFRLQRYGDAARALERFLAVAPRELASTRALGHAWYSLGRYAEARDHYARVLAVAPDDVEARRGLALCHHRLGDSDAAAAELARVVEREPDHGEAWLWSGRVAFDAGRVEAALAAARRATQLAPRDPRGWFLLAQARYESGDDEGGEAAQARFAELDREVQDERSLEARLVQAPRDVALLEELVHRVRRRADPEQVRAALARLVRAAPERVASRVLALDALESIGDDEGAGAAAAGLEQIAGRDAAAWERLRRYYARVGDLAREVRAGERALRHGDPRPR